MNRKGYPKLLIILLVVFVGLPLVLAVLRLADPGAVLIGLLAAAFVYRGLTMFLRYGRHVSERGALQEKSELSRTIHVQLVDERGMLLPCEERDRRMAEAYRNAGPRDVVVPVTRKA